MRRQRGIFEILSGVFVACFLTWSALGQPPIKLYLADGTYHQVKSYEVRGDRVRYWSVERSEWEEVPKALVDFAATERAQNEEAVARQKKLEEVRELEKQRFEKPEPTGVEIAAGIRLPAEEGVYAFDGQQVMRVIETSTEVITDKKRAALALALPGPFIKARGLVILRGSKSPIRILSPQPVFYVRLSDGSGARLELVALKPGKEARLVQKAEPRKGILELEALEPAALLQREEIAPGLLRLTLNRTLELGEYALAEIAPQQTNRLLWEFGIDGTPMDDKTRDEGPPTLRRAKELSRD